MIVCFWACNHIFFGLKQKVNHKNVNLQKKESCMYTTISQGLPKRKLYVYKFLLKKKFLLLASLDYVLAGAECNSAVHFGKIDT